MAISRPHYFCLKELHRRGELPQGGALLEIGEANWYGDIQFPREHSERMAGKVFPESWVKGGVAFCVVKFLYWELFRNTKLDAIDFDGPTAEKRDLNTQQVASGGNYETIINHGTAEHIFNIANVYRLMHDQCKPGGLMIHESPFTGWIDHGFFTIQPTLYYDLAAANGYDLRYMAVTHIEHGSAVEIDSREQLLKMAASGGVANNSMLFVAMRKVNDEEFKIPMQGFYSQSISPEASEAWRQLR